MLSDAMEPAVRRGARLVVSDDVGVLERLDVVVARVTHTDIAVVKRVVGLPGETVDIRDGVVTINGEPLAEPYLRPGTVTGSVDPSQAGELSPRFRPLPLTLGATEYFLLGDNRTASNDSRANGPTDRQEITARVIAVGLASDECRVFAAPDANDDEVAAIERALRSDPSVGDLWRVSKAEALEEFTALYAAPAIAAQLGAANMPVVFRITLRDVADAAVLGDRANELPRVLSTQCGVPPPQEGTPPDTWRDDATAATTKPAP